MKLEHSLCFPVGSPNSGGPLILTTSYLYFQERARHSQQKVPNLCKPFTILRFLFLWFMSRFSSLVISCNVGSHVNGASATFQPRLRSLRGTSKQLENVKFHTSRHPHPHVLNINELRKQVNTVAFNCYSRRTCDLFCILRWHDSIA